jgi:hypothetical protein
MIKKLKQFCYRASLVFVTTLLVAVNPAVASADTIDPAYTPPVQTETAPAETPAPATPPPMETPGNTPLTPSETETDDVSTTTASATTPVPSTTQTDPKNVSKTTTVASATVDNKVTAAAQSGDALVDSNDHAGSALTGNATVSSTTVTSLQSSSSFTGQGGSLATFTHDIDGNQLGDILLDPSIIGSLAVANSVSPAGDLTVQAQQSGTINNEINLDARSGSATVSNNDRAGDATTGDAHAIANIVNIVRSVVGAEKTFVGTININGSLDGDILLPEEMKNLLNAQNAEAAGTANGNLSVENNGSTAINNTVNTSATSGDATVTGNDRAGNATTGSANTNVTLLNLTGHEIVGANSLVVFVNVQGTWVGFIVDAPQGATSAALGSGVTNNTAAGTDTTIQNNTEAEINNTVNVHARSGDALVVSNDRAGNATSGNASASANILNMTNTTLSMGGWFGILFINVLGSWNGSFGVDTEAGGYSTQPQPSTLSPEAPAAVTPQTASQAAPQNAIAGATAAANSAHESMGVSGATNDPAKHKDVLGGSSTRTQPPASNASGSGWLLPALGLLMGILLLAGETLRSKLKARRVQLAGTAIYLPEK